MVLTSFVLIIDQLEYFHFQGYILQISLYPYEYNTAKFQLKLNLIILGHTTHRIDIRRRNCCSIVRSNSYMTVLKESFQWKFNSQKLQFVYVHFGFCLSPSNTYSLLENVAPQPCNEASVSIQKSIEGVQMG